MKITVQKHLFFFTISFFISLITFFIIFQLISSKENEKRLSEQQLIQEAKAHFQGMVDTRAWNAQYGGVYVKAKDGLKPNPYLKNNTLLTSKNETLIKINPAWMTRQVSEISNKRKSYQFKITSLKPLNPSNKADEFETEALKHFEKNKQDKYFYTFNNEDKSFNFMGSLQVQKSCLKCHAHQGYKLGDIRGGIRVSVPLTLYNEQIAGLEEKTKQSITIILAISLTLIGVIYWLLHIIYKRKFEIEHANEILEEKVSQRTNDLKKVISHEQHLKDVLKIITEVNEMLITSYSTKTILENATTRLSTNDSYSLVVSALIYDDILEIVSKSREEKNLIPSDMVSLKDKSNILFEAVLKAIKLKHPITEKVNPEHLNQELHRREDDLELKWMMVLPLVHGFDNDVYGMIAVFCSIEDGFELEEMQILENMSHDISIALHSHKQRNSILKMEQEKTANYEETILAFVNIIEQRDTYTAGHTIRVAEYCARIAKQMGFKDAEIRRLEKAAILHDIGKVATPDTILLKPGKLSHLEYELIKLHSEVGADMLERISTYKDLATIIRYHHCRYDGNGYPKTTSPDDIPMLSHIMIVADAFDAMTTNRIYRPRKSIAEAIQELEDSSSTQFHPDVVEAGIIALKDVNIAITSQMPTSELEGKRMSYFFQDSLTGLYNEDYLQILLNSNEHLYKSINIIDLKKFTLYNQTHGWENGNILLKDFAKSLKKLFPDSVIIRYHGDDFIVLDTTPTEIDIDLLSGHDIIKKSEIEVRISYYEIDQFFNYEDFKISTD
jgi:two-component system, LuxR family, sensor histidine kinase TtrS